MSQSSGSRSMSADSASAIMSQCSEKRSISAESASKVSPATASKKSISIPLLYEGNFDEWQRQISDVFIAHGRPTRAYPSIAHVNNDTVTYHPSPFGDMLAIIAMISPELKARIPLDDLEAKACVLYAWLEKLCKKPFRIFSLPAELRLRIYEEVLEPAARMPTERNPFDDHPDRRRPALAQASQQLRQEVLPVYIAITRFTAHGHVNPLWLSNMLTQWEQAWPGTSLQALNYFSLNMPTEQCVYDDRGGAHHERFIHSKVNVKIYFSESNGLQIDQNNIEWLSPESRKVLNDVCAEVEAERKENNAKGEAILVLLRRLCEMGDPDIMNWLDMWEEDLAEEDFRDMYTQQ